jgi:hypothetical protein
MSSDTSNAYLMRKESRGAMANQRPSAAIGGHQRPSVAIRGHQWPSEALGGSAHVGDSLVYGAAGWSAARSSASDQGGDRAGSTEHCLELGQCERREKNLGRRAQVLDARTKGCRLASDAVLEPQLCDLGDVVAQGVNGHLARGVKRTGVFVPPGIAQGRLREHTGTHRMRTQPSVGH